MPIFNSAINCDNHCEQEANYYIEGQLNIKKIDS